MFGFNFKHIQMYSYITQVILKNITDIPTDPYICEHLLVHSHIFIISEASYILLTTLAYSDLLVKV